VTVNHVCYGVLCMCLQDQRCAVFRCFEHAESRILQGLAVMEGTPGQLPSVVAIAQDEAANTTAYRKAIEASDGNTPCQHLCHASAVYLHD
jgi:hypothetical protein